MTTIVTGISLHGLHSTAPLANTGVDADKARIGMNQDGTLVLYSGRSYLLHPNQTRRAGEFLRQHELLPSGQKPRDFRLLDLMTALNTRANGTIPVPSESPASSSRHTQRLRWADQEGGTGTRAGPLVTTDPVPALGAGSHSGRSDPSSLVMVGSDISLGAGSRGRVVREGDRVVKSFRQPDQAAIDHELAMCNAYLQATQGKPTAFLQGSELVMPYVHGEVPTAEEVMQAVRELFAMGFMMGDPAPANFVKTADQRVVPVDFGLMFQLKGGSSLGRGIKAEIVHDYIQGGYRGVPTPLRADYAKVIKEFDVELGRDSPARSCNVRELKRAGWFGS